jgi:hypothetical protein
MARIDVDKAGSLASSLCAVHCALLPVALGVLPALGPVADPRLEAGFFFAAVGLGVWALVSGHRRHGRLWPVVLFLAGIGLLVFGHALPGLQHGHAHWPWQWQSRCEHGVAWPLTLLGGLALVGFHAANARLRPACACQACAEHEPAPVGAADARRA